MKLSDNNARAGKLPVNTAISLLLCTVLLIPCVNCPKITASASELTENTADIQIPALTGDISYPDMLLKESSIAAGDYIIDGDTGEIYYFPDHGTAFRGGIADDGYAYDEYGRQRNSETYILEKYEGQAGNDRIIFESENDEYLYVRAMLDRSGGRQGGEFPRMFTESGLLYLTASDIARCIGSGGSAYDAFIEEKASSVSPSAGVREKVKQAGMLTWDALDYDYTLDSTYDSLNTALANHKGVCWHYVRIMEDILKSLGVSCEPVVGYNRYGDLHSWLCIRDDENGCLLYADPSCCRYPGDYGAIDMETYLSSYTQMPVR